MSKISEANVHILENLSLLEGAVKHANNILAVQIYDCINSTIKDYFKDGWIGEYDFTIDDSELLVYPESWFIKQIKKENISIARYRLVFILNDEEDSDNELYLSNLFSISNTRVGFLFEIINHFKVKDAEWNGFIAPKISSISGSLIDLEFTPMYDNDWFLPITLDANKIAEEYRKSGNVRNEIKNQLKETLFNVTHSSEFLNPIVMEIYGHYISNIL